jgi:hypothetical protein
VPRNKGKEKVTVDDEQPSPTPRGRDGIDTGPQLPQKEPAEAIHDDGQDGAAVGGNDEPRKKAKGPKKTKQDDQQGASPPPKTNKRKQDALDKEADKIRTAALAGPPILAAAHYNRKIKGAGAAAKVQKLVAKQSLVEETDETFADLAPLWIMCEKCALYLQFGKYPYRVRCGSSLPSFRD